MAKDLRHNPKSTPGDSINTGTALNHVLARIHSAALQCNRVPAEITLLAVSKLQSADAIRELVNMGQHHFGENYLQEALAKQGQLKNLNITWHYIGQLQSNKTRQIAECFSWVHTIDRLKIAERLNEQRPAHLPPLNVCIQMKLHDEPGKGGVPSEELFNLAAHIASLPQLKLRGLMCIPPPSNSYEEQLGYFQRIAALLNQLQKGNLPVDTLSMGMSGDLEAAIAAGATVVRVGTALFGERKAK